MHPHSSAAIVAACLVALVAASNVFSAPIPPTEVYTNSADDVFNAFSKAGLHTAEDRTVWQRLGGNLMDKFKPAPKYDVVDTNGNIFASSTKIEGANGKTAKLSDQTPDFRQQVAGDNRGLTSFTPKGGAATDIHQFSLAGKVDLSKGVRGPAGKAIPPDAEFILTRSTKGVSEEIPLTLDEAGGRLIVEKGQVYVPREGDTLAAKISEKETIDIPVAQGLKSGESGAVVRFEGIADETSFRLGGYKFPASKDPYDAILKNGDEVKVVARDGELVDVNTMKPIKLDDLDAARTSPEGPWIDATKYTPNFPASAWFARFWQRFQGRFRLRNPDGTFGPLQWKRPADPTPEGSVEVEVDGIIHRVDPTKGAPDGEMSTLNNAPTTGGTGQGASTPVSPGSKQAASGDDASLSTTGSTGKATAEEINTSPVIRLSSRGPVENLRGSISSTPKDLLGAPPKNDGTLITKQDATASTSKYLPGTPPKKDVTFITKQDSATPASEKAQDTTKLTADQQNAANAAADQQHQLEQNIPGAFPLPPGSA